MRAIICEKLGDPCLEIGRGVLKLDTTIASKDKIPNDCIKIKVAAASINFADALQIKGEYQVRLKPPFTPGAEASGVVVAVGSSVTHFKIGDKVCAFGSEGGALAEEFIARESHSFLLPDGCDLTEAAALPVIFGTAEVALVHRAGVRAGQTVLVLGAAGGVGVAAVQLCKLLGARTIAAATGPRKCAFLRELGADVVLDLSSLGPGISLSKAVKKLAPEGVDVIFDPVGGELFLEGLKCAAWGSQYLVIGFASGSIPKAPANLLLVKNMTMHGIYWGSYAEKQPEVLQKGMAWLLKAWGEGKFKVPISHRFPLEQASEAFKTVLAREVIGKVVVVVGASQMAMSRL